MRTKGFTLIELLIVVAIIGILAAIAVPNFLNAQMRAKVSRTIADMKSLHTAMEEYRLDHNDYPPDYDSGTVPGISGMKDEMLTYSRLTTPVSYMSSIPFDPFFLGPAGRLEHVKPIPLFQYAGPPWSNNVATWRAVGTRYTVTSLGPDKLDQQAWSLPPNLVLPMVYQASNGLTSLGDLYLSNQGLIF